MYADQRKQYFQCIRQLIAYRGNSYTLWTKWRYLVGVTNRNRYSVPQSSQWFFLVYFACCEGSKHRFKISTINFCLAKVNVETESLYSDSHFKYNVKTSIPLQRNRCPPALVSEMPNVLLIFKMHLLHYSWWQLLWTLSLSNIPCNSP